MTLKFQNSDQFPHILWIKIFADLSKTRVVQKVSYTIESGEERIFNISLKPGEILNQSISFDVSDGIGRLPAQTNNTFLIPFLKKQKVLICQSFDGKITTHKDTPHAIDFCAPERTPITAARDGVIVQVVQNFTEGRPDPALLKKANRIVILHEDGLMTSYGHLYPQSAQVRVGEHVSAGQVIALVGSVGYASGPHLHFEVKQPKALPDESNKVFEVIEPHFVDKVSNQLIKLRYKTYYQVEN